MTEHDVLMQLAQGPRLARQIAVACLEHRDTHDVVNVQGVTNRLMSLERRGLVRRLGEGAWPDDRTIVWGLV